MKHLSRVLAAFAIGAAFALIGAGEGEQPPADLVRLERAVGLKAAHARDVGPVDPEKRKLLSEAEQSDLKGEDALKAGDYSGARDYFTRAMELLSKLDE
ncbi:MAG: hypothetical protein WA005_19495 [Candidatus Binataceae bacterium]